MRAPAKLLHDLRTPEGRKGLRYLLTSLAMIPAGIVLLQVLGLVTANYTAASLLTSAILTPPNFLANRYYVWQITSRDNLRTQLLVFWISAVLGTAAATGLVFAVDRLTEGRSTWVIALAALVAQIVGYGTVWVGRYFLLDRWLFKVTHHGDEPAPGELAELHHDLPI